MRYSELKKLHDSLETLKAPLPKFPSTNWWRATNSSPELIEERREQLDEYFRQVLSTKVVRESLILKNFVLEAQKDYEKKLEKVCLSLCRNNATNCRTETPPRKRRIKYL